METSCAIIISWFYRWFFYVKVLVKIEYGLYSFLSVNINSEICLTILSCLCTSIWPIYYIFEQDYLFSEDHFWDYTLTLSLSVVFLLSNFSVRSAPRAQKRLLLHHISFEINKGGYDPQVSDACCHMQYLNECTRKQQGNCIWKFICYLNVW